jgi:hypothetical protein
LPWATFADLSHFLDGRPSLLVAHAHNLPGTRVHAKPDTKESYEANALCLRASKFFGRGHNQREPKVADGVATSGQRRVKDRLRSLARSPPDNAPTGFLLCGRVDDATQRRLCWAGQEGDATYG